MKNLLMYLQLRKEIRDMRYIPDPDYVPPDEYTRLENEYDKWGVMLDKIEELIIQERDQWLAS